MLVRSALSFAILICTCLFTAPANGVPVKFLIKWEVPVWARKEKRLFECLGLMSPTAQGYSVAV